MEKLNKDEVYSYHRKSIPYAKTDPAYSKVYINWLKQTVAAGYTAPKPQKIRAYIAPDSTGNNTQQEQISMCGPTIWGKDDTYYSMEDLGKKLNIPTQSVAAGGANSSFDLNSEQTVRTFGWIMNTVPSSAQVSQEIYKNHYYGIEGTDYAMITTKETFAALGTINSTFKLDNPTDKNIGKLTLK